MASDKVYGAIKPPQASEPESNVMRRLKQGPGTEIVQGIKKQLAGKLSAVKNAIGVGEQK